ncbi:MAG: hypothetical protein IIZ30_07490 [Sphingomonas sp.]|uniref:hypothetical protein n=1 Tax=Sphingomonas sp. TaxID=28214 RepID=UPI0025811426|nr:hypothetical protein [Sphingomonas sp.]MBQ1479864.1 hypothetical protein [Sphingomonas sp.]
MTFAHDFAFYRGDRHPGGWVPDEFWPAFRIESRLVYEQRRDTYPDRVTKGRMMRVDADRELRVARAIAECTGALEHSPGFPIATWSEIIHCLRREITLRRQHWPQLVLAKRIAAMPAELRLLTLEVCHDVLWHSPSLPEARTARAALADHREAERQRLRAAA